MKIEMDENAALVTALVSFLLAVTIIIITLCYCYERRAEVAFKAGLEEVNDAPTTPSSTHYGHK